MMFLPKMNRGVSVLKKIKYKKGGFKGEMCVDRGSGKLKNEGGGE